MKTTDRLLLENKAWAQEQATLNPKYFENLTRDRACEVFWIGCSDSGVHADIITNSEPGEIMVHRNAGNQVVHSDFNLLGALEYAVCVLKAKHIVVCGHYRCKALKAAMGRPDHNLHFANKWLKPIKDIYRLHRREIEARETEQDRWDRLAELNIVEQVHNLAHTAIVQRAWHEKRLPSLHGWIYGPQGKGVVGELIALTPDVQLDPLYRYDLD